MLNSNLTDLNKYKSVASICQLEIARSKVAKQENLINEYKNSKREDKPLSDYFSEHFKKTLLCLSDLSKLIIQEEFLNGLHKKENCWFETYFSKSTYYKKRKQAIDEFLFYYLD
ncbi:MG284/MPN403 family protein [Mycoplasmopsis gallinarum]|uniref:Phage protein n=1 Tax=Mycoplasmopsis gallinarum TaxID=29557 RepID=A0A168RKP5_9BACT|nr:hypothetical protein [Mycoplasmopsis gallinarum]OAB49071.1 hypothetical protein MGALLINA_01060 [Mycoplasmopsis gallinarum]